jgi:DNA repair protein SbcD/Mre11
VLIAPGNHDFYSPSSYYHPDFVRSHHHFDWPANVHLFTGNGWSRQRLPALPGVAFTGIAFTSHSAAGDRPVQQLPAPEPGVQNVLVFHGSRTGFAPPGKQAVLPFTDGELERSGYDYAALGHYHNHSLIESAVGRLLGAYSGCPAGRGLDECGPRGVLLGELTSAGATVELVPVDGRTIHDLAIDCTGIEYQAALLGLIEQRLREAGCRDDDIIYLRLGGRHGRGLDLRLPDGFMAGRCFHLQIDAAGLTPAYDLDRYRTPPGSETTEGRFVAAIEQRLAIAADDQERARLQRALYYGLDALIDGQVAPRYEPVGSSR